MKHCIIFVTLSISLFVFGCGGSQRPANLPKLHPCTVKVTLGDAPLADALVVLSPSIDQWFGNGATDSSGTVKIKTQGKFSGMAVGEYKVLISKSVSSNPNWVSQSENDEPPPMIDYVDSIFSNPSKTPLDCTIKAGNNAFDFRVEAPGTK